MNDLISRQAAIDLLLAEGMITAAIYMDRVPCTQPEQKHGKWIKDCSVAFYWKCSECGSYLIGTKEDYLLRENDYPNYCPNCGARMEGTE